VIYTQGILQNRSRDLVIRVIKKRGKLSKNHIVFGQFLYSVKKCSKSTKI